MGRDVPSDDFKDTRLGDASRALDQDSASADHESLIVLSDVHLGSDIIENRGGRRHRRRSPDIDRDLIELLRHYRRTPPRGRRWRLVIAGDFIDFIGIIISADPHELETEPSWEERAHGLGNASDHARIKLRRVLERHEAVFSALGEFLADGHALTIVRGNHDLELYWESVQEELADALFRHASASRPSLDRQAFDERLEFAPWFFYRRGIVWIEHGHQYDPFCAIHRPMVPLSPRDPRRIERGLSDVLLRFVVRPTEGMFEHGHEKMGILDYLAFGFRLGLRGLGLLFFRFAHAVVELIRLQREQVSQDAETLRKEHERRMALLAEASRIGKDRLFALMALSAPPVTASIRNILASVLLDRLALGLFCSLSLLALGALGVHRGEYLFGAALVGIAWAVAHVHLARQRKLDPGEAMVDKAGRLARLFSAAYVVMGHTHVPMRVPVADGEATYVNLGSWSEDEPVEGQPMPRAPRTHLVVEMMGERAVAELLSWDSLEGPRVFGG